MFKSTKDVFDEIYKTDRLENKNDYFDFNHYELSFYFGLSEFLDKSEDNTQDVFIEEEIKNITTCLTFINYLTTGENNGDVVLNDLLLQPKNEQEEWFTEFINVFFKHRTENKARTVEDTIATFKKIMLFLNHKKNNVLNDPLLFISKVHYKNKNTIPLELTTTPKHEKIFCNNGFVLFEAFSKLHIIDKYIDFSFLFQQMKFNGYILDIKHVKFMDWLLDNEYINSKEHEKFLIDKSFRSLKKCAFGTRVDLYLKLKDSLIAPSSDLSE